MGSEIADRFSSVLRGNGIDYEPSSGGNSWLWCLGGPEMLRAEDLKRYGASHGDAPLDSYVCVDLQLFVCDLHKVVSVELEGIDVVAERGGSGPDDPRQSEPIELGEPSDVVANVMAQAEPWLNRIIVWPPSG